MMLTDSAEELALIAQDVGAEVIQGRVREDRQSGVTLE